MPNQETSIDQYRSTLNGTSYRKPSFIENLGAITQRNGSRKTSESNSSLSNSAPKLVKEEVLYQNKSLSLSECTYSDADGRERIIPVIHKRSSSQSSSGVVEQSAPAGILSIGILKRHILCDCLILVKKYRPSLKSYVLEFPAKIVEQSFKSSMDDSSEDDESSSTEDMAAQNVEESTGFRSTKVQWISPETAMEPDLSDHKLKIVSVLIDGDDPLRNNCSCADNSGDEADDDHTSTSSLSNSSQRTEIDMEVIPVPINGLLDRLDEYDRQGVIIDARVYAFAIGLKKGEKLAMSCQYAQPENIEAPL